MRVEGNLRNYLIPNQLTPTKLHCTVRMLHLNVTSVHWNVTLQFYDCLFTQNNVTLLQRIHLEVTLFYVHLNYV